MKHKFTKTNNRLCNLVLPSLCLLGQLYERYLPFIFALNHRYCIIRSDGFYLLSLLNQCLMMVLVFFSSCKLCCLQQSHINNVSKYRVTRERSVFFSHQRHLKAIRHLSSLITYTFVSYLSQLNAYCCFFNRIPLVTSVFTFYCHLSQFFFTLYYYLASAD